MFAHDPLVVSLVVHLCSLSRFRLHCRYSRRYWTIFKLRLRVKFKGSRVSAVLFGRSNNRLTWKPRPWGRCCYKSRGPLFYVCTAARDRRVGTCWTATWYKAHRQEERGSLRLDSYRVDGFWSGCSLQWNWGNLCAGRVFLIYSILKVAEYNPI